MNPILQLRLPYVPSYLTFENIPSPISGEFSHTVYANIQVNEHTWSIVYSQNDDLWWVHPRPDATFYEALYTKLFYSSPLPEQFGYASLEIDGARRTEKAAKNWDDIEHYLDSINKNCLLEIGCGTGEFLLEGIKRGWATVHGNELESASAQIAQQKNLLIDTGFFENYTSPNETIYDLIFADNVLEHTMQPLLFVQKAYTLTATNGFLILRLPDTQPFGPTLKLIDHTFHFTRSSIKKLVEMAGFNVVDIFYSGTFKGTQYESDAQQRIENMTVVAQKV